MNGANLGADSESAIVEAGGECWSAGLVLLRWRQMRWRVVDGAPRARGRSYPRTALARIGGYMSRDQMFRKMNESQGMNRVVTVGGA